jgi:hypothetical protein
LNRKRLKLDFAINHTLEIAPIADRIFWQCIYPEEQSVQMQIYSPAVLSSFRQIPIQREGRHTKHTMATDVRIIQTEYFFAVAAHLLQRPTFEHRPGS